MKLLSKRQVRQIVLYNPAHIARLKKAGLFPKRVRLGQGRVGWIDSEVDGWVNAWIAERDQHTGS